jgi:Na+-driven multidrug efflux pump
VRIAWVGAAVAFMLTEAIGLAAASAPHVWLSLFSSDPQTLAVGSDYLRIVGPFYGMFGAALAFYFASQGAGRMLWPLIGNLLRLAIAAAGGWIALELGASLALVVVAQSAALCAFAFVNAFAVARGAWFGPLLSAAPSSPLAGRPA